MVKSPATFKRPSVLEVNRILKQRNGLIVHFSGAPKGLGIDRGHYFPADLQHICASKATGGVSCSVVMPGDIFAGRHRNAIGCIGLVLELKEANSLVAVSPTDCGTFEDEDGNRIAPFRDISAQDVKDSISRRPVGNYNEWVLRDFHVAGLFAAFPYEIWKLAPIDLPADMPDYLCGTDPAPTLGNTSIAEIRQLFLEMPIFSFKSNQVVKL